MVSTSSLLKTFYWKKKRKKKLLYSNKQLHNLTFPSFNLLIFTEEGDTTINNEVKRILSKKKC